MRQSLLASAPK